MRGISAVRVTPKRIRARTFLVVQIEQFDHITYWSLGTLHGVEREVAGTAANRGVCGDEYEWEIPMSSVEDSRLSQRLPQGVGTLKPSAT